MAASSDILLASDKASLGLPEVDVGLLGGCRHAMRLFGHSRLRRMMLTGMRVTGDELYRLGIVEACTTVEGLMPAAYELAATIAAILGQVRDIDARPMGLRAIFTTLARATRPGRAVS